MVRRLYLLLILIILAVGSTAQTTASFIPGGFKRMLVSEGLPSSEVYETYQDKAGYLWLATDAGVCRYNGISFVTYTTLNGLPDNTVFHIREDSEGKIWVQTFTGEIAYFSNNRFWEIAANDGLMELFGSGQKTPYTFFVDEEDNIVIGGLYIGGCYNILKKESYASLHHIDAPLQHLQHGRSGQTHKGTGMPLVKGCTTAIRMRKSCIAVITLLYRSAIRSRPESTCACCAARMTGCSSLTGKRFTKLIRPETFTRMNTRELSLTSRRTTPAISG